MDKTRNLNVTLSRRFARIWCFAGRQAGRLTDLPRIGYDLRAPGFEARFGALHCVTAGVVLAGSGSLRARGRHLDMEAGTGYFRLNDGPFEFRSGTQSAMQLLVLAWPASKVHGRFGKDTRILNSAQSRVLRMTLEAALEAVSLATGLEDRSQVLEPYLQAIYHLAATPSGLASPSAAAGSRETFERCRTSLELHARHPDALALAAAEAKVSPAHFRKLFQMHAGQSPARMLRAHRLDHAAAELCMTSAPVKQIAYEWGFKDPLHFSRLFRQRHLLPPTEYRRLHAGAV